MINSYDMLSRQGNGVNGPKGSEIPIIASALVKNRNLKDLVLNNSQGIELFRNALDQFKSCGFDGFIAGINNVSSSKDLSKILNNILKEANVRGLFVIFSSDVFSQPSQDLLNSWETEWCSITSNQEKSSTVDKCKFFKSKFDSRISDFITACTDEYPNSFGGINLDDEPTYSALRRKYIATNGLQLSSFDNVDGLYYCLSNRYNIVRNLLPDNAIVLVNLVGDQDWGYLDNKPYNYYLNLFSNIMNVSSLYPYLWCYDYYPITSYNYLLYKNFYIKKEGKKDNGCPLDEPDLSRNGIISVLYEYFYEDLWLFNYKTNNKNSVFWTFIQSMEYMAASNLHPLSKESFLRFTVFSSLAMGCQGIIYWTYHQRDNENLELYLSALLTRDGDKTPAWYYAKKINEEIKKYSNVFRNSEFKGYGHVGEIYEGCNLLSTPLGIVKSIEVSGKGVLVTQLDNGSKEYIIIVSHDVIDYQDITIVFSINNRLVKMIAVEELTSDVKFFITESQYSRQFSLQ